MSDGEKYDGAITKKNEYNDIRSDPPETGKWVSVLVALVGIWLVGEGYLLKPFFESISSDIVVGLVLIALAGYNYLRRSNGWLGSATIGVIVVFLGVWLIASLIFGGSTDGTVVIEVTPEFWSDSITGLVTVFLGTSSIYLAIRTKVYTEAAPK